MQKKGFVLHRRGVMSALVASTAFASHSFGQTASPAAKPEPLLAIGRAHTDFVQTQVVPGRVLGDNNSQPGVEGIPLSYNAKGDKAVTVLFRYPVGWSMPRPHYVNSDQEFYVLDGSLDLDGTIYKVGDYAYLPAGYQHNLMASKTGALLLNYYEGEHLAFYEPAPAGMYIPERLIKKIETKAMAWSDDTSVGAKALGKNVQRKLLRTDAATGESTWLVKVDADDASKTIQRPTATHQSVEEMFVIEGEVSSPRGVMRTGAYVWRAPNMTAGPFGTKTGYVAIMRSKGGALNTTLSANKADVMWDAPYDPMISEGARNFAFKTYDPSRVY